MQEALHLHGVGAKTAVGYGYFEKFENVTEQERKSQVEQAEQERLNSLPKIDRLCEELKDIHDEQRSHEIYNNKLGDFEGDDLKKLAAALKAYWQSIGKWNVKAKKKKQKEKVDRLKTILGE